MNTIESVSNLTAIEDVRDVATELGIKFSGNTGVETLKDKIVKVLELVNDKPEDTKPELEMDFGGHNEPIEIAKPIVKKALTVAELIAMDPTKIEDVNLRRQVIRAQATRLIRVRIQNLDPGDAALNGAIITTYSKYTGKIAKYVPFGEESANGYHIPKIIFDFLKEQKFALRKEKKGGRFGVKTYSTNLVSKFNIEVLPPLTREELADLAAHQRASQSIDN
jgi:hypothetical protein